VNSESSFLLYAGRTSVAIRCNRGATAIEIVEIEIIDTFSPIDVTIVKLKKHI
jgi:hypothetical protein